MDSTLMYGAHVPANGIRQHYLRFGGKGDALVVVPGITSPAATWSFVGERFGAHFDTYVLDVRGRGLSSGGADLDYSLDACAADVAGLASALGIGRYHLLGHSMGARIAARHARLHATEVRRLLLADPPLSGPGRRPYVRSLSFYTDAIEEAKAGRLDADRVRATYPGWSDAQLHARAQWLHTCDIVAIAASHRGFAEEEIQTDFPALTMPVMLLAAGKGGVITDDEAAQLQTLQPSLEYVRLQGAGHMLPFDDLEGFMRIALDFLAGGERGS